ncbi:MAG: flagellar hook-basal body complex protein FliE [Bdellovibrionales bacterium]
MDPITASQDYQSLSNIGKQISGDDTTTTGETGGAAAGGGTKFADFLKDKAQESVDTLRKSEQVSAQAVVGEADIVDVVQAVTSAELTLQTVVSVRDRMISAYQEIMRMPI